MLREILRIEVKHISNMGQKKGILFLDYFIYDDLWKKISKNALKMNIIHVVIVALYG